VERAQHSSRCSRLLEGWTLITNFSSSTGVVVVVVAGGRDVAALNGMP